MDDVDASFDFLEQYTEAMVLAAYEEVKQGQAVNVNVLRQEQEEVMNLILDTILDRFVLPSVAVDSRPDEDHWRCNDCGKKYKKVKSLRKHRQEKHGAANEAIRGYECNHCRKLYKTSANFKKHIKKVKHDAGEDIDEEGIAQELEDCRKIEDNAATSDSMDSKKDAEESDSVYHYSRCALFLGLFACNFNDARKYGDGERTLRLYKFLCLMFKLEGKTKYAYYTFQFLCQVFYLLPEELAFNLVFNRFVNNKGRADSNVEIDREVEHWNKLFKMDCREFNGKVTPKSIDRASCSYQSVDAILTAFDHCSNVHRPSGRHTRKNVTEDVTALAEQLKSQCLFKIKPGRKYQAYPSFPKNQFSRLDVPLLKEWMIQKLKHFRGLNVYSNFL